jgi:4-amino-4-deoxy-L-arabinose transferase-like glycosyltransferase
MLQTEQVAAAVAQGHKEPRIGVASVPSCWAPVCAGRKQLVVLLVILGLGLAVRLGLWAWFAPLAPRVADEWDYNRLACNLVQYGEYSFEPGRPDSLRPPLYPAVVAGVYQVFGVENYQAVRLLQAFLSLLTVVLVYYIGTAAFSARAGLWAAGMCCFYPSLLAYNNLLLTETVFTLLLCAFCALAVHAIRRQSLARLAAAGAVLGLAALTRSVLWLFPPVLAVVALFAFRAGAWRRLLAAVVAVAAFAIVLAPWAVRNTRLHHTFIAVDVMGGRNFMMGNYRYTPLYRSWATIEEQGERSWIHELLTEYPREVRDTQGKLDKVALRQALRFVAANPGLTLQRDVVKFFDFWGLERELVSGARIGFFGPIPAAVVVVLALLICGAYVAVLFAGIFGMFLTPPDDRRVHAFLILLIAFVCGIHTLAFGHSRYHLPLMPLLIVYAAAAVAQRHRLWRPRCLAFWAACGVCAALVGGWLWQLLVVDRERVRSLVEVFLQRLA